MRRVSRLRLAFFVFAVPVRPQQVCVWTLRFSRMRQAAADNMRLNCLQRAHRCNPSGVLSCGSLYLVVGYVCGRLAAASSMIVVGYWALCGIGIGMCIGIMISISISINIKATISIGMSMLLSTTAQLEVETLHRMANEGFVKCTFTSLSVLECRGTSNRCS